MKKDLLVKILRKVSFIWKEAKRPVLRIDAEGDMTLLPCKSCTDKEGKPKLSFKLEMEFALVYVVLAFVTLCAMIKLIFD